MGVIVEEIRYTNEFTGETTNYLLGNVGDKITIDIDFRAEEVYVTGNELDLNRMLVAPQPFRINSPDSKDVIFAEQLDAFINFKVGDTVDLLVFGGATTTYRVYEKLSNEALRVETLGGGFVDFYASNGNNYDIETPANSHLAVATDLTSIIYRYNFVENASGGLYNSPIDNQVNQLKSTLAVDNTDLVTVVPMAFSLPVTNDLGSATVKGNGTTTVGQRFTLTHTTFITPFFLADQLNDIQDNIKPNYFNGSRCLKFVTSIDVGRDDNDPNFIETVDFDIPNGNTGWFDENFNGNAVNYSIDTVEYFRVPSLEQIDSIELTTDEQNIEIVVKNTQSLFVNGATKFVLNHIILPDDVDDYRNNSKDVTQNFRFDRATNLAGASGVLGDNFGTSNQIIKGISSTFVDANEIKIIATLAMDADILADLLSRTGLQYLLWVSIEESGNTTEDSDRVSLKSAISTYFNDVSDDTLVATTTKFLEHYESDTESEGNEVVCGRVKDDIIAYSRFYIDRLGRETDTILINSVELSMIAKKTDGSEFTLESHLQPFSGATIVGDSQFIDVDFAREFKMPTADQRKTIKIDRRSDLDTSAFRYYDVSYPFIVRWEDWEVLAGVNDEFFDTIALNNGYNHNWNRYDLGSDWDIYHRISISITKNGDLLDAFVKDSRLETFTYIEDANWTNEVTKSFDEGGTELINGSDKFFRGALTKIQAEKDYIGADPITLADVAAVMKIEIEGVGGINDTRFFSSVYDWTENSWFKSIGTTNKIVLTEPVAGTFRAEAYVDLSLLPSGRCYTITTRYYNKLLPETCCLITEDEDQIMVEDGLSCLTTEDCGDEIVSKLLEDGSAKQLEDGTNKILE